MEIVKKHKVLFIVLAIALVLGIILFFGIKNLFYSNGSNKFGNRLEGIEAVKINQDVYEKIKAEIEKTGLTNKVTYHMVGKRINYDIDVKKDTALEAARELADKIVDNLSEEQKKFFDIQVVLTQSENEESELYPAIGYRSKNSNTFSWSNKNLGGNNEA